MKKRNIILLIIVLLICTIGLAYLSCSSRTRKPAAVEKTATDDSSSIAGYEPIW